MFTKRTVLKAIGSPNLSLYRGNGYWYFEYDDVPANKFDTRSVYTMRLSDLPLATWIDEGKELVAKCNPISQQEYDQ